MRRNSLFTAVVFFLLTTSAFAKGQTVSFASSAAGNAGGYLALPEGKGKHPAVILIQEWWGMNDWVTEQADRFAKQGYVALAVDLYRGRVAKDANEAHELMRGMPEDRAMADLQGGFKYLTNRKDVDAKNIGVIGWCMGGGYALMLADEQPKLAAAVMNYGHLMTDAKSVSKLKVPLLGNFGAEDRGIPAADVNAFEATLKKAGKKADFKVYPVAGHGFMNPNNKEGYVKTAADDAWSRIDAFFTKYLKH
jgi:carboxymethylenebutenolidase